MTIPWSGIDRKNRVEFYKNFEIYMHWQKPFDADDDDNGYVIQRTQDSQWL